VLSDVTSRKITRYRSETDLGFKFRRTWLCSAQRADKDFGERNTRKNRGNSTRENTPKNKKDNVSRFNELADPIAEVDNAVSQNVTLVSNANLDAKSASIISQSFHSVYTHSIIASSHLYNIINIIIIMFHHRNSTNAPHYHGCLLSLFHQFDSPNTESFIICCVSHLQ